MYFLNLGVKSLKVQLRIRFTGLLPGAGTATIFALVSRPVVALIEIEIQDVDWAKQRQVHSDVMRSMGPADPTIVVSSGGGGLVDVADLLEAVEPFGNAVLVRWASCGDRVDSDDRNTEMIRVISHIHEPRDME